MQVPLVDLKLQYSNHKVEFDNAIQNVIDNTAFIKGPDVLKFENRFKESLGVEHCVGCANGTDAIFIALKALGIGQGDEVITVCNTWISTSETISQTGATPVFVDIDPLLYNIDIDKIEEKITPNTKAIIPVHLFGQAVDMPKLMAIASKFNLRVIEDCAQAHYAKINNQYVGTYGDIATFSFFPGKNLGAYGDAGGIVTNNSELAEHCRMLANHGGLVKNIHRIEGLNSRLDTIQAAVLNVKMNYIAEWTEQRQRNAACYSEKLSAITDVVVPTIYSDSEHVFHLYVIRTKSRADLQKFLKEQGVATGIHYPTPLPLLEAYNYLHYSESDIPVASAYKDEILSLPMYPELSLDQIDYVVTSIAQFFQR